MNNWKKNLLVCFLAIIVLSFIGCDSNGDNDPKCNCPNGKVHTDALCSCNATDCNCTYKAPEVAKDQSATLNDLFGEGYSATVTGHMKDSEWVNVSVKLKNALNGAFNSKDGIPGAVIKDQFRDVFGYAGGVTIIVGDRPAGFTYETIGDITTLYINFGALNNADLQAKLIDAVSSMDSMGSEIAKAMPAYDKGWQKYDLAKQRITKHTGLATVPDTKFV